MKRFNNKVTGVLSSSDLKTIKGKIIYWIFFIVLMIVALASIIPAIWTVLTAFKDTREIYESFSFFPKDMSPSKMISRVSESWGFLKMGDAIVNTVLLSLGQLAVRLLVCGFGGYALSKFKPTGTKLVFTLVVWTMMMPSQIRLVPNYMSYIHFPFAMDIGIGVNMLDTFWPLCLTVGANTYSVLLFKNAFDSLSNSYVEAARIDGCSDLGIFFKIMMPLSLPIIIYESIMVLSNAWSEFFNPMLILDKNTVVPLEIYRLQTRTDIQMNTYFMALVFASIPPFLIYTVFQKRIMGGVNVGGVKG